MKVAVFGRFYNATTTFSVDTLFNYLKKRKIDAYIESEFYKLIDDSDPNKIHYLHNKQFDTLNTSFDLLISIGGDGTILRAITFVKDLGIPIIGINTGRLGFLATIQVNDIERAIQNIIDGKYRLSERSLLTIETSCKNEDISSLNFALNEIAVSRKNTTSMITVETHLNGEYLTSYWSDGLIVSTPTGSTGYSLSCGGPVITPDTNSFVITPIAPHNLSARPLIITDTTEIQLKVTGREESHLVSLDSRIATLENGTIITIKKAPFKIKMIDLLNESFLTTLRKKLLWGEDKRN
ncbi:MAG: NAD kinase [Flavobacteriales bacterium]|nr:NAD kinase [Flavobacteriia bacterium]NCP05939.1 NAD kinase [Flavobacteriales bacterium]PIV94448.1 MAG: NAD kinase [Flavobacteriaceae bacterium CG17_big_fil_post_rev_8_21_14_2_50_33_15]PIY12142.1 MAG: NAD kinase [Flavobacteriaceae bacterium CG_4_10_14_3_um_filter_33_47]PJB17109.1 MAG: NAD kinase [Flavobacteriaceae bacterium CG_4_9_14_3_um_filter_33_16]